MDIIDEILNKQPINTTITINPIKSSVGTIATLTANIVDINGNKVSGGKAVFKINGITLKDETGNVIYARVSDGLASIQYKVQDVWMKDTSYIEAVYSGTNNSRVRPRTTKWSQIETVFGEELVKCIEGSQSVDDTIKNSQKAISDLMNE